MTISFSLSPINYLSNKHILVFKQEAKTRYKVIIIIFLIEDFFIANNF